MPSVEDGRIYTAKYVRQQTAYQIVGLFSNFQTIRAIAVDFLRAAPFWFPRRCRLDQVGVRFTVGGGVGALIRIGVYDDTGNLYPNRLIVDTGAVDASAPALAMQAVTIYCNPGEFYWLVINNNNAAIQIDTPENIRSLSLLDDPAIVGNIGWRVASAYGALPDPFPAGAGRHYEVPTIHYRIAEFY